MNLKTFQSLTYEDYKNATYEELKDLVRWGAKALNPRINRLYNSGAENGKIAGDSYRYIEQTGGLFSTVSDNPKHINKTINELRQELKREINFSNMETSTVRGARRIKQEREDILRKNYNPDDLKGMTQEQINDLLDDEWEKFRKFNESHGVLYKQGKTEELYQMYMSDEETRRKKEREHDVSERERKLLEEVQKSTAFKPKWTGF